MKLKFNEEHKSIKSFEDIEISDFSILTGKNGSGKTQLLEAIMDGKVIVEGIDSDKIKYFNAATFQIPKESQISNESIKREKLSMWTSFITTPANRLSPRDTLIRAKNASFGENTQRIEDLSKEKNKPILLLELEDVENNQELFNNLVQYEREIESIKNQNHFDHRIIELAFNLNSFVDEITQEEFMEKINAHSSEHHFFAQEISKIFVNFNNLCSIEYAKLIKENEGHQIIPKEFKDVAVKNVLKKYADTYPWDYLNNLFESFEDFKYKISKPNEFELEDLDDTQSKQFTAILHNAEDDLNINFDELSSGEKTLLAMALMMFNTVLTKHFPKLVLLDEIDSALHPSMTQDLLFTLQNIFKNHGIKVILVTHSPSTVAFAEEESVCIVDSTSENLIEKSERQEALKILTQGFMILEDSNIIFDAINRYDLTIFSEGNNVKYIKTAMELQHNELLPKVHVWEGIEGKSSVGQLSMLYELLSNVDLQKKILIVFDPEAEIKVETNEEKKIFVTKLKSAGNSYKDRGIESVLPDSAFEGCLISVTNEVTGNVTKSFNDINKKTLGEKVNTEKDPTVFANFKPLTDQIAEILQ
ncbi:ATP-binding protein [Nitrosopumilus sp.]|uniref:ATP-binding protein n=1 Tax=Nitrosopumilus sp. TaxID=2024843 RepID=UPI00262D4F84|nr:ATP-binding protein [Nitrosopumilus sp.]